MQIFDQLFLERPPVPIGCMPHSSPLLSILLFLSPHVLIHLFYPHHHSVCFTVYCPSYSLLRNHTLYCPLPLHHQVMRCFFAKVVRILTFYSLTFTCGSCGPVFNESVYIIHSEFCSVLCSFLEGEK